MSLEKLIKTLAKTVDMRQEMRDINDMPVRICWCCVLRTTNADGSVASEFWYQATNNGASGYSCAFSVSGPPKKKYCGECGYLVGQGERGPSYVDDAPPITRPGLG